MTSFKFALEIRSRPVDSNALIVVGVKISNVQIKISEPKMSVNPKGRKQNQTVKDEHKRRQL